MEFIACVLDGFCQNGVMFAKFVIADCKFMHKGSRIETDMGIIMENRVQKIRIEEIRGLVVDASKTAAEGVYNNEIKQILEQSIAMKIEGKDRAKMIENIFKKAGLNKH
jgi:hypothetical protein